MKITLNLKSENQNMIKTIMIILAVNTLALITYAYSVHAGSIVLF